MGEGSEIGGWPKIINEEPQRPHSFFNEPDEINEPHEIFKESVESDETDQPYDINHSLHGIYLNTENTYAVMQVFVEFHALGLYPPKWALDHLAIRFQKHLTNPDPDLLTSQLGISGRGSGSTNPHDEYTWMRERRPVLDDMMILMGGFDISFTDAAKAIIEKHDLPISSKRLMNNFREYYRDPKPFLRKNRGSEPWNDPFLDHDETRRAYLDEFPRRTLRYITNKTPTKR